MTKFSSVQIFLSVLYFFCACTPKNANKISDRPITAKEPTTWDAMGKPIAGEISEDSIVDVTYDDLIVTPDAESSNPDSLIPYQASHTFEHDLIHTKMEIGFDWTKKRANSTATLTLRPWFYATDVVNLDAKNFDILSINFEGNSTPLKYDYNNEILTVKLGKTFTKKDEFKLVIKYVAKPDERTTIGGSAAITSDKGLYFINPDGSEVGKPMQIWTQGETESNSCWFPTVDKPNERCTQEIYITVEDKYKTLSNGLLLNSKKNADGTRTDYWKMDKPHAPYLFMMAIGEFAVVKDKWRDIELSYLVEPKYEKDATAIFAHTPEMLEFFSTKLNYKYPWSKYAQVVVRDYVSGAMENTGAVIFGEYVQLNKRELLDNHMTNEKVVAHEMFHHWFGDLVTTESWANLTMNEGFANYSEYLWLEHKYGRDEADAHEMEEQQGFIFSASDGGHPLIHFGYNAREDMFDSHSYNKGGAVLHMLREIVGDDAFWASLNRYLTKNEYTDVEAHELRLAFEDVTGQDLSWFFNQWYFKSGYPTLDIIYDWDEATKETTVTIAQTQAASQADGVRVFNLPMAVDIYDANGKARRENIRLTKRLQQFTFKSAQKPALVNVDATKSTLAIRNDAHTPEEWAFMFKNAPLFRDRFDALEGLGLEETPFTQAAYTAALSDKFWGIRQKGLEKANLKDPEVMAIVAKIAENDPKPQVRAAAIAALSETNDKKYIDVLKKGIGETQAYSVVGASLSGLVKLDPAAAITASKSLENDSNESIIVSLSELYATIPTAAQLPWFQKNLATIDFMSAFAFFENYTKYLIALKDVKEIDNATQQFKAISLGKTQSQWRRFGATKSIAEVRNAMREAGNITKVSELQAVINEIKAAETDETLKLYYDMF
jgi:aminopeptidase N